jgi:hypothetical protein
MVGRHRRGLAELSRRPRNLDRRLHRVGCGLGSRRRCGHGCRLGRGGRHGLVRRRARRRRRRRTRWLGRRRGGRRRLRRDRRSRRSGSRRSRRRRRARGEERGGIDVRLAVAGAHAHVDVRHVVLGLARGPTGCHGLALGHRVAPLDEQSPEVRERRLVPLGRRDGDGQAMRGHGPGERHIPRCRSPDGRRTTERDVDAAMLATGVRVVADRVAAQHLAVRRPRPGPGVRCRGQRRARDHDAKEHRSPRLVGGHGSNVAVVPRVGNAFDGVVTESANKARFAASRSAGRRARRPAGASDRRRRAPSRRRAQRPLRTSQHPREQRRERA